MWRRCLLPGRYGSANRCRFEEPDALIRHVRFCEGEDGARPRTSLLDARGQGKMRITLLTTWSLINSIGGAERVFCNLANAMAKRGHQITGICFDVESGEPAFPLDCRVTLVNAGVGKKPPFFLTKFMINLRALCFGRARRREKRLLLQEEFKGPFLISAIRQSCPDVIIAFRPEDAHLVQFYGKLKVPVVTMSHNSTDVFLPSYTPECLKQAIQKSVAVQVLMPSFAEDVKRILPQARVVVIPNPVPQIAETANRASHVIVNVGRIAYQKHQDLLVEAFALIADMYPDWIVKIYGGNRDKPKLVQKLKKLIKSRGLTSRVLLCGETEDVYRHLKEASIFAFPSRGEGFALALAEAMSMGIPPVGCITCPAVNCLIRDEKNGFLSDENVESFAQALTRLMDSEDERSRLGNVAKKDMRAYAPDKIWDKWEEVLLSVSKDKKIS